MTYDDNDASNIAATLAEVLPQAQQIAANHPPADPAQGTLL